MMVRKAFLIFTFLFFQIQIFAVADEGMWLPLFLKELNETDMQSKGMKISADEVYNINSSSLKDAIVSFGGFCTGEVISSQGLVLTNHHCGYGQIQSHSSVGNDLLTEGFWAMNKEEELPNPGLFVTFIVEIKDVTNAVLDGIGSDAPEKEREDLIAQNILSVSKEATNGTHYKAVVKPFFYGNEYYMFITETYNDIRLVGAPPSSIGKFGGDTDNWMWTRHTGDFSLFRIYASPDGKPAHFSKDNVPYQPKHHLPVNLNGINEGDFTMVFGFPGRTNEYLTSFAILDIMQEINPHRIKIRERKLAILNEDMKKSDAIRIQYASKYASTANAWKKWIGESNGLKRLNAIERKRELEAKFEQWANEDESREKIYGSLITDFEKEYYRQKEISQANNYIMEAVFGIDAMKFARTVSLLAKENFSDEELNLLVQKVDMYAKKYFKDYHSATDQKVFAGLIGLYYDNVELQFHPESLTKAVKKRKDNFDHIAQNLYDKSYLTSEERFVKLMDGFDKKSIAKLKKDPVFVMMNEFMDIYEYAVQPILVETEENIEKLSRYYLAGLRQMQPEKNFYPDANGTLRVAFGQVEGYRPKDGVDYKYFTTLEGIIEKENPDNEEFIVPEKLKELHASKDYGHYGKDGVMPVCFTASNHTTGGNSGSPVINSEGHLIGTNFDRNWEGTMSDIMYDPEMCRNISVDIRYTLFIIDKFAGAGHLVEEMTIIKEDMPHQEADRALDAR